MADDDLYGDDGNFGGEDDGNDQDDMDAGVGEEVSVLYDSNIRFFMFSLLLCSLIKN